MIVYIHMWLPNTLIFVAHNLYRRTVPSLLPKCEPVDQGENNDKTHDGARIIHVQPGDGQDGREGKEDHDEDCVTDGE